MLRLVVTLTLVVTAAAGAAQAQDKWQIDSETSVARLALGSGSDLLNVGVARVSGEVVFDSSDRTNPKVMLTINPGNPQEAEYASMKFQSRRSVLTADGKLIVSGDLAVTRVERSVTADPNEGYSGQQYGAPVAYTRTRAITLVFADPRRFNTKNGEISFSGTSTVFREDFPQLLDAMTKNAWPSQLVNDETCTGPATIGEDYHGAECTGTIVASVQNPVVASGTPGAEDFSGSVPSITPNRDKATIALDLRLREVPGSNVASAATSKIRNGANAESKQAMSDSAQ